MKALPLFALLICLVLASCGKIEDPEFRRLDNFGVRKLGLRESTVGFNASYYNPNQFGVSVKEAVFDIYVDSVYLGKFTQPQQVEVSEKSEFSIPLEGTISLEKALNMNIPSLVGRTVLLRANGSVKLGKAGVFINRKIDYKGQHKLDETLIKNPAGAGLFN